MKAASGKKMLNQQSTNFIETHKKSHNCNDTPFSDGDDDEEVVTIDPLVRPLIDNKLPYYSKLAVK